MSGRERKQRAFSSFSLPRKIKQEQCNSSLLLSDVWSLGGNTQNGEKKEERSKRDQRTKLAMSEEKRDGRGTAARKRC